MKVLKHGNTYIEREIECKNCGALISCLESEITKESGCYEVFGGDWHSYSEKYIICPECKNKIKLSCIIDGKETVKK